MKYSYETPEHAIISLETAYTNKDIESIFASKDFSTEAKLFLAEKIPSDEITKEAIVETAELFELLLRKTLQDNGFPGFSNVTREFSELRHLKDNTYIFTENIAFPNGIEDVYEVVLSVEDDLWKVVSAKQINQ